MPIAEMFLNPLRILLIVIAVASVVVLPSSVFAHGGSHAGPVVTQMNKETALEVAIPESAKAIKKIAVVDQAMMAWAEETYGVRLKEGLYSYFIAEDKSSGEVVGGAIVKRTPFRKGKLSIAVGLDGDQQVTNVALMSINKNYLFELERDVGKGVISNYNGMTVDQIVNAKELSFNNKTQQQFAVALREAAVLLSTLMHSKQDIANSEAGG